MREWVAQTIRARYRFDVGDDLAAVSKEEIDDVMGFDNDDPQPAEEYAKAMIRMANDGDGITFVDNVRDSASGLFALYAYAAADESADV